MPRYTIENTTGRVKAFKVYGGLAEVGRNATETLDLSNELTDEKITELAATGVYVTPGDAPRDTENDAEKDEGSPPGLTGAPESFDEMNESQLRFFYEKKFNRTAHPQMKRETMIAKLREA